MIKNYEKLVNHICLGIKNFTDIAVIGLSGGADSTLTAILSMHALGRENVHGVSMPYNAHDERTFNTLSEKLARRIGIHHHIRPVSEIADAINQQIFIESKNELTSLNKGNSRSRARMCILYGISRTLESHYPNKRVRVMGTGNLSEDFIGYDTKGGDALADIFPIGELFKSEVYQLLDYFRDKEVIDEDHINRIPSAGLEDGQTDEKDLGYTYNEMEKSIRYCLKHYGGMNTAEIDKTTSFVWNRHKAHKHKHEAPHVIKTRDLCD